MFNISVRPQREGFALFIDAPEGVSYHIEFLVIGAGGRETSGELQGTTVSGGAWRFQPVGFAVLRVGITNVYLSPHRDARQEVWQARPPGRPETRQIEVFQSSAEAAFMMRGNVEPPAREREASQDSDDPASLYAESGPYAAEIPYPFAVPYSFSVPYSMTVPYSFDISYLLDVPYPFEIPYPGERYP